MLLRAPNWGHWTGWWSYAPNATFGGWHRVALYLLGRSVQLFYVQQAIPELQGPLPNALQTTLIVRPYGCCSWTHMIRHSEFEECLFPSHRNVHCPHCDAAQHKRFNAPQILVTIQKVDLSEPLVFHWLINKRLDNWKLVVVVPAVMYLSTVAPPLTILFCF